MNVANIEKPALRRDKIDLVVEILGIARKGATKTRIMYRANMSSAGINEYLFFLIKTRLLTQTSEHNRTIYKSTEKGLSILTLYGQLTLIINENDYNESQVNASPFVYS